MAVVTLAADYAEYGAPSAYYWTQNNTWNAGSLVNGRNYTESITLDTNLFPNSTTFKWSWPDTDPTNSNVYAYPEIFYGGSPWTNGLNPNGLTPPSTEVYNFQTFTASVSLANTGNTGNMDNLMEVWLTSAQSGNQNQILYEVGVYLHQPAATAPSTYAKRLYTYTDSNLGYVGVYESLNIGNPNNAPFIQIQPLNPNTGEPRDVLTTTIDWKEIFQQLVLHGVITGYEWVSGIEMGTEIMTAGGSGSTTINTLSYTWVPNSSSQTSNSSGTDRRGRLRR